MRIATLGFLICCVVSCKNPNRMTKIQNDGDPVYELSPDDMAMNLAIEYAASTFDTFVGEWRKKDTANRDFVVKMPFQDENDDYQEHMWVTDLFSKGDTMYGVLDNSPARVTSVAEGDTVRVYKSKISDWSYVRNGKLVGGYTIKVLYKKMSDQEKRSFLESLDYTLE